MTPAGNVYTVKPGATTVANKTGASWGVDFSVNLGTSGLTLSDVTAEWILHDAVTGTTTTSMAFNPLLIPDNSYNSNIGAQNSETLSFASIAAAFQDPGYNEWIADTYTFTLNLYSGQNPGTLIASDTIVVDAVPEPGTITLLGAALLVLGGIGIYRRLRV